MQIIRAGAANLDDIVCLNSVVQAIHVEHEPGCFSPFDEAAVLAHIQSALQDPTVTFLLASEGGKPLGYVMVRVRERKDNAYGPAREFLELEQIVVAKDSWKRGVGSALIDEAFALARSLGISSLELSVWDFNKNAQRLFRRKGFEPCWQRMRTHLA